MRQFVRRRSIVRWGLAVAGLLALETIWRPLMTAEASEQAPGEGTVKGLVVSPVKDVLFIGQTRQFAVQVKYEGGEDLHLKPTWSVTGDIGAIDQDGLFSAGPRRAKGTVVATLGAKTAAADVEVVPWAYGACHSDGRIVYSVEDGGDSEYDLMMMAGDGADPVNLTPNAVDPPEDYDHTLDEGRHGCWSPDGKTVVFEACGRRGQGAIAIMNADGSRSHVVKQDEAHAYARPTFWPDGTLILFDARPLDADGNPSPGDICVMNADGTNERYLTDDPLGEEDACWSPDGSRIAFIRERETPNGRAYDIWLMDGDGRNARRLTPEGDVSYLHPAWSPDSTGIACTVHATSSGDIGVIKLPGGSVKLLTQTPDTDEYGPVWTWDGTHILFATQDAPGLVHEIWSIAADGSADPTDVTNRPGDGSYLRWFEYSY